MPVLAYDLHILSWEFLILLTPTILTFSFSQELERDCIVPCMELLRSISWEQLAAEYSLRHRALSSHVRALSRAEGDLISARKELRAVEDQLARHVTWHASMLASDVSWTTLDHLSAQTLTLEREVGDAVKLQPPTHVF